MRMKILRKLLNCRKAGKKNKILHWPRSKVRGAINGSYRRLCNRSVSQWGHFWVDCGDWDRDSKGTVAVELLLFLLRLHLAFDIQQVFAFIDFFCLNLRKLVAAAGHSTNYVTSSWSILEWTQEKLTPSRIRLLIWHETVKCFRVLERHDPWRTRTSWMFIRHSLNF